MATVLMKPGLGLGKPARKQWQLLLAIRAAMHAGRHTTRDTAEATKRKRRNKTTHDAGRALANNIKGQEATGA